MICEIGKIWDLLLAPESQVINRNYLKTSIRLQSSRSSLEFLSDSVFVPILLIVGILRHQPFVFKFMPKQFVNFNKSRGMKRKLHLESNLLSRLMLTILCKNRPNFY